MGSDEREKAEARGRKKDKGAKSDLKPGTVEGELDFYDNVTKPVGDALKAAEDWLKGK